MKKNFPFPSSLFLLLILSLLMLAAGACVAPAPLASPSPAATLTADQLFTPDPVVTATASPPSQTEKPFLIYTRSGGIMGKLERWEIYADGRLVSGEGKTLQASKKAADTLSDQLTCANFPPPPSGRANPVCADCFTVTLERFEGDQTCALSVVMEARDTNSEARKLAGLAQTFIRQVQESSAH